MGDGQVGGAVLAGSTDVLTGVAASFSPGLGSAVLASSLAWSMI